MGKNNKKAAAPAVEAPVVETPAKEAEAPATVVNIAAAKGLTQGEKVQFLTETRHMVEELRQEENPPLELINGYNVIRNSTIIDVAIGEIACGTSTMGFIFSGNEAAYKALQIAANSLGVTLPEFKSLPAPTKSQLEKAGISAVGNTQKYIAPSNIEVSNEAKKEKKAEKKKIEEAKNKDYMKDHTKIETDEQLKEALGFQLLNPAISNPIERLITASQFYRAYLEARAEKANDPQAELAKIHAFTLADLLQDITTMVPPTFIAKGFGDQLGRRAHDANSVIPAFCMFRNCVTDRKTGKPKYTDEEIATFVRVLIVWYVSAKNAEMSASIKAKEENIKVLKSDAKANAKAIESEEKKIAGLKSSIAHFNEMLSLVTDPSFEVVDSFIEAYNKADNANHLSAIQIAKWIQDTYYNNVEITELEFDSMLLNIQQRSGMILNLFSSEMAKCDEYNEKNLVTFEVKAPEESTEEDPKNE